MKFTGFKTVKDIPVSDFRESLVLKPSNDSHILCFCHILILCGAKPFVLHYSYRTGYFVTLQ